jgi:hypothetical protein
MRGGRAMTVTVVVGVAMMMAVGVGGKHLTLLYYNITSAKAFKALEHDPEKVGTGFPKKIMLNQESTARWAIAF